MDEAGVDRGILVGRQAGHRLVSNDDIAELRDQYPGRFPRALAGINGADDLISIKINGTERGMVGSGKEVDALVGQLFSDLESAKENSRLPDNPPKEVFEMANDFLLDCRGI